jgi:hypothetical protein
MVGATLAVALVTVALVTVALATVALLAVALVTVALVTVALLAVPSSPYLPAWSCSPRARSAGHQPARQRRLPG